MNLSLSGAFFSPVSLASLDQTSAIAMGVFKR